jgi:uncharacterized protein (DUF697 family)
VQHEVLRVLQAVRSRHRDWPIVVAQTGLHRLYASGMQHPIPYPYSGGQDDETQALVPHALRQALAYQRKQFDKLPGARPHFVPVDFTLPEDGFPPSDFGLEMLWRILEEVGPIAFEALRLAQSDVESDRIRAKARPLIYGYGTVAAGAGAVPIPMVGVGGIAGMIAMMLRTLAIRYQSAWTPRTFGEFSGAIGGGALFWWMLRYGLRELLKLVPIVGTAAAGALNAAAAFAVTVAIGEAACVWLAYRHRGLTAPDEEVRRAFAGGLAAGLRRAKDQAPHSEQRA